MEYLEKKVYEVIARTYCYFEETGRCDSSARFPYLHILMERLKEETKKGGQQESGIQKERYRKLSAALAGEEEDGVLDTVLDLCLAVMLIPEFAAYLNYYTANMVTIQLAFELEGIVFPVHGEVYRKLKQIGKVCEVDWEKVPLSYAAIKGTNGVLSYLIGEDFMDTPLWGKAEWFLREDTLHSMFIREEAAAEGAELMRGSAVGQSFCREEDGCGGILQIAGGGGRRFLARHIARRLDKDLLFVSAVELKNAIEEGLSHFVTELVHETFLKNGLLCIYEITGELLHTMQMKEADFLKKVVLPHLENKTGVILCTGAEVSFSGEGWMTVPCVELKETTRAEREKVFRGFAELYGLSLDCISYSTRYHLLPSEIAKAVGIWQSRGTDKLPFSHVCREVLQGKTELALGNVIDSAVDINDLKVSASIRETLGQICCSYREGCRIFEEWQLERQYPYGRAVTVLLSGAPGTGKTMTAHALAKELGIPLYQVDLSHVMDKYIGETEKHLQQVFDFAEKTNMLLFFDEADSLFGKRGEVTEGKDRYANMEVSYILQRIEQYEGIVVLATNFYNNIDKAFLRRMKYVLKYPLPDCKIRRSIWESCLASDALADGLDIDYLAEQFEFTGGMIKNVVLNACVMAVYEKTKPQMSHMLRAIRAEYEKMEWTVSKDIWGEYGYLMEEREDADA